MNPLGEHFPFLYLWYTDQLVLWLRTQFSSCMASTRIDIMIYSTHTICAADIIRLSLRPKCPHKLLWKMLLFSLQRHTVDKYFAIVWRSGILWDGNPRIIMQVKYKLPWASALQKRGHAQSWNMSAVLIADHTSTICQSFFLHCPYRWSGPEIVVAVQFMRSIIFSSSFVAYKCQWMG